MATGTEHNILVDATKDYVSCNFNISFMHLDIVDAPTKSRG